MKILQQFRKTVKFTAFFFSVYFILFSSISYAQYSNSGGSAPAYVQVTIPQELGTISNSYFTSVAKSDLDKKPLPSAGLIIHIQDAHGQVAAQKNIEHILEYLVTKYGFQTVFLEGGLNGKISPDLLRFFKDETKNEKVANQLLEDGRIEGADVFLLKNKGRVSAYGLESARLYRRNILAFREVINQKKDSETFLTQLKKQIFSFGSNYFSPELNKFAKEWLEFQDSRSEMLKHLVILDEYARKYLNINLHEAKKQFDYPQLVRFFSIKEMERDYGREEIKPRIHSDLKKLQNWLAEKKLNPAYAQVFESLVNYSYSSLNPSFPIDVRTFLESFYAEAKPKGFSFSDYYVFMKYLGLLLLAQELESDRLFDEIKKMNVEILKSLAKTPEENSLVRLIRDYFLVKKLFFLELTRDEYAEVMEKEKALTPYLLTSRLRTLNNAKIKSSVEAPRELIDLFQSAMRFYALAGEREDRMVSNMLSVLDAKPEKRIILITGGFHSRGLETLFRGQRFSFIEVTLRMSEVESNQKYVEQMLAGASTVPAISVGKIPLPEIRLLMGDKEIEFQEQAIQRAIAASLGANNNGRTLLTADPDVFRSLLFQHINSLETIPTLHVLAHKKVFELFGNKEYPRKVRLMTIAKQSNADDPLQNLGNLYGAMRTLALNGLIKISGVDEITRYELTEEGWKVVMLAEREYFREAVDAISHMKHYHTYFRGPPSDSSEDALPEFEKLIALSVERPEIADLLMSPVMVALGMPLFEEQQDGSIKEKDPSFFKLFDKETQTLNLDSIQIRHDRKFLDAAFNLLVSKGLAKFVDGRENLVRLTPLGVALKNKVASYGVTNAYLNFYAKLDDALFGNPDPVDIANDGHIDRVMDIWGASGSHKPYLKNKQGEGILAMVEKIFNLPLDQQPKGIADMGCGDGKMLAEIVEFILRHTERGKHLNTHPLAVVAADYSPKSQGRALATLKKFAAIPGVSVEVLFGDVTNPEKYDGDIQARF